MKTALPLNVILLLAGFVAAINGADQSSPIDPVRGRELMRRFSQGEKLTPEEQAYLERVREEIRKRARARQAAGATQTGPARPVEVSTNDWIFKQPLRIAFAA